jgi:hypothetical protein
VTFTIMTFSIMKLCNHADCRCAECHDILSVMLNVNVVSAVMLSVVMLNVFLLSVVAPWMRPTERPFLLNPDDHIFCRKTELVFRETS